MLFAGMVVKQPFAAHFLCFPLLSLGDPQEHTDYVVPSPAYGLPRRPLGGQFRFLPALGVGDLQEGWGDIATLYALGL